MVKSIEESKPKSEFMPISQVPIGSFIRDERDKKLVVLLSKAKVVGALDEAEFYKVSVGSPTEEGHESLRHYKIQQKVEVIFPVELKAEFLLADEKSFIFVDENFNEFALSKEKIGNKAKFLKEGEWVTHYFCGEDLISMTLPSFVELEVESCEKEPPSESVSHLGQAMYIVTLENGASMRLSAPVGAGEIVKIDTVKGGVI